MPSINISIIPPVIAHRGASAEAPENTLAAFIKAKQLGLNWVEFDVMLAACGEVVVIHDEELSRTTNGNGRVIDYPYSDLKKLDAGSWFNPIFSGEKIPTLEEVLALLVELNMAANIEIKALPGYEEHLIKRVFEVINHSKSKFRVPNLISSFSYLVLENVKKISPESSVGFLMHEWQSDWKEKCDQISAIAVDVNHEILDPIKIQQIKSTNRLLLSYTVNNIRRAKDLLSLGVDGIFSDCPKEILLNLACLTNG